jgi:vitamin B12 transporter
MTAWSALTAFAAPAVLAQAAPKDTVRLSEIVVTPTKVPTLRSSIAAAITVLRGDELRERGITLVADALRDVVGAAVVQPGSFGALTSLFLRGGQSDYTSVLVDGVPINDPGGAVNLADLTTDNVDRIEIVRGPASVLYGSDAVAGVVQVFTRRGQGPTRAEATVESGLFDAVIPGSLDAGRRGAANHALRWQAGLAGGNQAVAYSVAMSRTSTDGLYTTDGTLGFDNSYLNTVASGFLRAVPDERTDASLMARYSDHRFHYPTDGAGRLVDRNALSHGTARAVGLEVGRFLTPHVETRLLLVDHVTEGGTDDEPNGPADTVGLYAFNTLSNVERRRAEARANLYGRGGVLTLGGQVERQSQESFSAFRSSFGNSTDRLDVKRLSHGFYAQAQGDATGSVSFNAGVRLDRSETFGTFVTYRAGLTYRPFPGLRLRATAGTGFKEPTFYQNFATGFARGNPNLKPEHSTSWEAGVEQTLLRDRVSFAATYFSQRFRDLIDFTFAPPQPTDPNYFNIAGAEASGAEFEAGAEPFPRLAVHGSYALLHTRVTDGGFDPGPGALLLRDGALLRRPNQTAVASVRYAARDRARLGLHLRYVGDRDDLNYSGYPPERIVLRGYATVGLAAEVDVVRAVDRATTLTVRLENLFDAKYEEAANFPARGRTMWLGARARF